MRTQLPAHAVAALDAIDHLGARELPAQELLEELAATMARVVGVGGFFAGSIDPDTGFLLAGNVYDYPHEICRPFWEHEFSIPDYNKFADLTPERPVADLREATGGRLSRSARYRTLNALCGLEDELRAVFYAGGRPWGNLQLSRRAGDPPFTAADLAFVRAAAPRAGAALRRALLEEPAHTDPARGPGVVVLDANGTIVSATEEADAWLEELAAQWRPLRIHPEVLELSLSTLATGGSSRRVRLRTPSGTWLIAHASALGDTGQVALVIEPAKASEVAPIVVEAYGLTPREVEVTRMVARGLSTDEIAAHLCLSRHTVRDHLKAIFEKVGVSSRAALVSKVFAEHYQPRMDEAIAASWDRTLARMSYS